MFGFIGKILDTAGITQRSDPGTYAGACGFAKPFYACESFFVKNVETGMVLTVEGDVAIGADICLRNYQRNGKQLWTYKSNRLHSVLDSTLCLDVRESTKAVMLWTRDGGPYQKWTFHDDQTCHCGTGEVLDILSDSRDADVRICVRNNDGGSSQRFVLQ